MFSSNSRPCSNDAQIYVNGVLVGSHKGGYNGFSIDATPAIVTSNGLFQFEWPSDHTGWQLQMKSNLLDGVWVNVPETETTNIFSAPMSKQKGFYRLIYQ